MAAKNRRLLELPELNQALLDQDLLAQWFADLEACAEIHEIVVKQSPTSMVGAGMVGAGEGGAITLVCALQLLQERKIRAVQLRYLYQNNLLWDTIMVVPDGYQLIRMEREQ